MDEQDRDILRRAGYGIGSARREGLTAEEAFRKSERSELTMEEFNQMTVGETIRFFRMLAERRGLTPFATQAAALEEYIKAGIILPVDTNETAEIKIDRYLLGPIAG